MFTRGYNSHKVKHYRRIIKTRATHTRTMAHPDTHATPKRGQTRIQTETHIHTDTKTGLPYEKHATRRPSNPENALPMLEGREIMLEGQTFRPFKHHSFTQPTHTQYITQNHDIRRAKIPTLRTYFPAFRTDNSTLQA